jgi:hypothetical protein
MEVLEIKVIAFTPDDRMWLETVAEEGDFIAANILGRMNRDNLAPYQTQLPEGELNFAQAEQWLKDKRLLNI